MATMTENVCSREGHLQCDSPTPIRLSILEVNDKQLPYEGKLSARTPRSNQKLCNGIKFTMLDDSGGLKNEGKLLLSALTGGRLVKKNTMPLLPPLENNGVSLNDPPWKNDQIDKKRDDNHKVISFEGVTTRSGMFDVSVDTSDLLKSLKEQVNVSQIPEPPTAWLFDSKQERESYDRANELPTAIETISLQSYLKSIKDTKEQIHIRTEMLEELKLAENVEEIDHSLYVEPMKPKSSSAVQPVGAMCATSLVIKYARRLAGVLDSSTRVVNLEDVGIWLQQLASIATVKEENIELPNKFRRKSELEKRSDWRLPLSPEVAVLYAQDDLRQRLGMECKTERFIRKRKAELEAAKKLMKEKAKQMATEQRMREYLETLDTSAPEAELASYDNSIATSLVGDVIKGDGFVDEGDGGGGGIDNGNGGGIDDGNGGEIDNGDGGGIDDGDGGGIDDGDGGGADNISWVKYGSLFCRESNVGGNELEDYCWSGKEEKIMRSIGVLTDPEMEETLLRIIEGDDENEVAQQVQADQGAAELTRMRREMIKLKRQLRFWRARSWVTQHRAVLATKPTTQRATISQTDMDLKTMSSFKALDTNIVVPRRGIQEFVIPDLPLHLLGKQTAVTNSHQASSRLGSKSGSALRCSLCTGQNPLSSYASPRLTRGSLEIIGQSPSLVPHPHSLEPV